LKDHLIIATADEGRVRIYAAVTSQLVEKAKELHDTWPTATAAFGRILTGTLIMGAMSDDLQRLTVQFFGSGSIGRVLAVSNLRGTVKGCLNNPHVDLELNSRGKFDISGAIGADGKLIVIKDLGLKEPYQGIVPLRTGEIAEDFAYYFTASEQIPTAVSLGVLINSDTKVKAAGGLIVQLMPGYTVETATYLEHKMRTLPSITQSIVAGNGPLHLVREVAHELEGLKILEEMVISYQCDCSWERFCGPLVSLGRHEIREIIKNQGVVEVRCHFCNQLYHYHEEEIFTEN